MSAEMPRDKSIPDPPLEPLLRTLADGIDRLTRVHHAATVSIDTRSGTVRYRFPATQTTGEAELTFNCLMLTARRRLILQIRQRLPGADTPRTEEMVLDPDALEDRSIGGLRDAQLKRFAREYLAC